MTDTAEGAKKVGDKVAKPLPDLVDPATAPFWAATRAHQLRAPRCTRCQHLLWPPEISCPECYNVTFDWEDVPHTGTLWSYATYHRALDPAFADQLPYMVGLVELRPGVKMYGIVLGDSDQVEIGHPVEAVFDDVTAEVTLVRWRLT